MIHNGRRCGRCRDGGRLIWAAFIDAAIVVVSSVSIVLDRRQAVIVRQGSLTVGIIAVVTRCK